MDDPQIYRRASAAKRAGDFDQELSILLGAVTARVTSPAVYERAAILLEKRKRFEDALEVLAVWRSHPVATSGNVAKINKRRARLEKRLGIDPAVNRARFTPPPSASTARRPLGSELPEVPERDPWSDVWGSRPEVHSVGPMTIRMQLVVGDKAELGAEFDRPLPFPARGPIDFVFVGGKIRYVDLLGSGETDSWATCSVAQEVLRLSSLVIDPTWVRAALQCCERIIAIRGRGFPHAFGFQCGNDSWPFRQVCREVAGRSPTRLESTTDVSRVDMPSTGHWMYCQDLERFVRDAMNAATVAMTPACVLYRGVARNDLFLQALLDAMSQRGASRTTCVLPDIPSMRAFAKRYSAGQWLTDTSLLLLEEQMFTAPIKPARRGVILRGEYSVTHYIGAKGHELPGAEYEAGLNYLESNFQARLNPADVLGDALLAAQAATFRTPNDAMQLPQESESERERRVAFERFYANRTRSHELLLTPAKSARNVMKNATSAPVNPTSERKHWWNR